MPIAGQTALVFDPSGYKFCLEPGAAFEFNGAELYEHFLKGTAGVLSDRLLYSPPHSQWLTARPLQFRPTWHQNSTLDKHVLKKSHWTFSPGITAQEIEWFSKKPDGTTYPKNLGVVIPKVPAGVTSLDTRNYANIASAAGVGFPAGMATVAFASHTPNGRFLGEADYAPHLSWAQYPPPDEYFVFGWANFCVVVARNFLHLLYNPLNDGAAWTRIGGMEVQSVANPLEEPASFWEGLKALWNPEPRLDFAALSLIPLGDDELHVQFADGQPKWFPLPLAAGALIAPTAAVATVGGPLGPVGCQRFRSGAWWVGGAPGQRLAWQAQVIGWEFGAIPLTGTEDLIDLTEEYKPTEAPSWGLDYRLQAQDSSQITASVAGGIRLITSTFSKEELNYGLINDAGAAWASDGTNYKADLYLLLEPNNPANDGVPYLCPQVRLFQVRWPAKLEDRFSNPLTLTDLQFKSVVPVSTLEEAGGKRLVIELWDAGAARLSATGHDRRENYPVHWVEDVDGDGVFETLRAAGWVVNPVLVEHRLFVNPNTGEALANPIRYYRLEARGLIERLQESWLYQPQVLQPEEKGYLEHTSAIRETLEQGGFDTADATRVFIATDPYAGTALARLPGTAANRKEAPGKKISARTYAPQWDESKLKYSERIAGWSGWNFYEDLDGTIFYHSDAMLNALLKGTSETLVATIYTSKSAAATAGAPGQYALAEARRHIIPPQGNVVRVTGKDSEGKLCPDVLCRETRSVLDPTYEGFIGEWKIYAVEDVMGIGRDYLRRAAKILLNRIKRRSYVWVVTVPLAPWQFFLNGAGPFYKIDAGFSLTLQGQGNYRINACEVELIRRHLYFTTLTLERLPVDLG